MATHHRSLTAFVFLLLWGSSLSICRGKDVWAPYQFLLGEWINDGDPSRGTGKFSFKTDLQGKILVRKNHAEFPASPRGPATIHDDLLVVYRNEGREPTRAAYFDSEGHVINYVATFSDDKRTLTFLSEPSPTAPRFRLSYVRGENETLTIRFEIAPPGNPEGFKTYLEGRSRRQKSKGSE